MATAWRAASYRATAQRALSAEQFKRFAKIYVDEFYLLGVQQQSAARGAAYEVLVSGSTRTQYSVVLHNDGTFKCSCPDARLNCGRLACVCKHTCFAMVRVLKFLDFGFYAGRRLTQEQLQDALQRLSNLHDYVDPQVVAATAALEGLRIRQQQRRQEAEDAKAPTGDECPFAAQAGAYDVNDDCPVCYDALGQDARTCVRCPTCRNTIHARCMRRWLQGAARATCVMCRSGAWATWGLA